MSFDKNIGVLGAGSWGTALVKMLSENCDKIFWYSRNEIQIKEIIKTKKNPKYLKDLEIDTDKISVTGSMNLTDEKNNIIGELRSGCYNPTFKQVIGIAMIKKPYFEAKQTFKIDINGNSFNGTVCDLPFI